jgi:hypothetical protein
MPKISLVYGNLAYVHWKALLLFNFPFFQQIEDVGHLNHEKEELKFLEERMNDLCVFYSVRTRSRLSSVN